MLFTVAIEVLNFGFVVDVGGKRPNQVWGSLKESKPGHGANGKNFGGPRQF